MMFNDLREEITPNEAMKRVEQNDFIPGHEPKQKPPIEIDVFDGKEYLDTPAPNHKPIVKSLFDVGSLVDLIAKSKERKSFWMEQCALSLATGQSFLPGIEVDHALPILFCNMELTPDSFHRRMRNMSLRLDNQGVTIPPGMFNTVHLRKNMMDSESTLRAIRDAAAKVKAEFIFVDPLYRLVDGDESDIKIMLPLSKQLAELAEDVGGLMFSHHDPKGLSGARAIQDRGSGSSVLARNCDARITLTPHKDVEGVAVMHFMARDYPPRDPVAITFDNGAFIASDVSCEVDTGGKPTRSKNTVPDIVIMNLFKNGPLRMGQFEEEMRRLGLSRDAARETRKRLVENEAIHVFKTKTAPPISWHGKSEQIAVLKSKQAEAAYSENTGDFSCDTEEN